jgi:hypothetical protein
VLEMKSELRLRAQVAGQPHCLTALGMSAADGGPNPAARVNVVASSGYVANLAGRPATGLLSQATGRLNALWLVIALFVIGFAASAALKPRANQAAGRGQISSRLTLVNQADHSPPRSARLHLDPCQIRTKCSGRECNRGVWIACGACERVHDTRGRDACR